MTKKDFKKFMRRGLGRCVLELHQNQNIEKYHDIILWGCTHDFSYDAQCEGTRTWYLYELIKCFPDRTSFMEVTLNNFNGNCYGWDFSHACHLLSLFASDGENHAAAALWNKYEYLYKYLKNRTFLSSSRIFFERDDFEELCIRLIESANDPICVYVKIAEDIGALYQHSALYDGWDFELIYKHCLSICGKTKIRKALAAKAAHSSAIQTYISELKNCKHIHEIQKKNRPSLPQTWDELMTALESKTCPPFWIAKKLVEEHRSQDLIKFAQAYIEETNSEKRTLLLQLFSNKRCPFPLSHKYLIMDTKSSDIALSEAAFSALHQIRHPEIRQLALTFIQHPEHQYDAICLLIKNYQKEDKDILIRSIQNVPVTYAGSEWHGLFLSVLDMFQKNGVKNPPKELLPYLYQQTLCSCCRYRTLMEMSRRHMLTKNLLLECLYDNYDEIRCYAKKRLVKFETS